MRGKQLVLGDQYWSSLGKSLWWIGDRIRRDYTVVSQELRRNRDVSAEVFASLSGALTT